MNVIQMIRKSLPGIVPFLLAVLLLAGCTRAAKKARAGEQADRYFQAGEYDKARIEYLNLLRLDHQNLTAFERLGLVSVEQGNPRGAIPFLFKIRELAPQNIPARVKLARAFMAIGERVQARQEAISILQQDPANADAIMLVADTSEGKEEIAVSEQQLEKFPQKNIAAFHLARASLALKKGEIGAASDEVQQAIAADPKSAHAHLALSFLYTLRKDKERATQAIKTAADLAPVRSEERIKYAEFQAASGAVEEAKDTLRRITKQAPDYMPAWRGLAQIALTEKKYDEALSLLENILSRDPANPEVRLLQCQTWLAKGEPAKAVAGLDNLNTTYPNNPVIKLQIARAYVASKRPAQAAAALEQAIAAKPDFAEAILALAELNLRLGKAQAVVSTMEDFLSKHPDMPQPRLMLADAYKALGRVDQAAALFRDQIKATPDSSVAHFFLGLILRAQKKDDEARQAFEKAAELAPNDFNPVGQLVEMDLAEKRYDAALELAQKQLRENPSAASSHFLKGQVAAAQQKWADAESALQKAIELDANFAPSYGLLVSVYAAQNKLPQAISQLEADVKKNPGDPRALVMIGLFYEQMKDYAKARDTYEKLIAANSDSVAGLNNLAYLYTERLPQLERAFELAQKARTLAPDNGTIADTLGWILYKRGDYQQAFALLQEAVSKFPDDPEVQFHVGMASYMMGRAAEAQPALEKAANAPTDFPGKDEAKRRLALLKNPASEKGPSTGEREDGMKQQPGDLIAVQRLAETYEKQGDNAKAAEAYEQVFKLNPKLAGPALKLAQLYAGPLRNHDKALEFARKVRALAPDDPETAGTLGRVAFQAGSFTWAYGLLQERTRRGADDAGVLHDLAMTAYALGKVAEARETMQRSLKAGADATQSADGERFLAMTALDQPSPEAVAAEPAVQKILKDEPDYVPALMAKAAIQLQRHGTKDVAGIYSEVLQKYPDFAPAQKGLAAVYAENPDELAKAYDMAMKARKTLPDDPELARTLAQLCFKRREFPYAVQLFEQSAVKQPLAAQDLYYLGMAQFQSRQEAKGRQTLERALAAGLLDPFAQEAKKRLAEPAPR